MGTTPFKTRTTRKRKSLLLKGSNNGIGTEMLSLKLYKSTWTTLQYNMKIGGGRVVRRCWELFRCQGVLLTWNTVGQGPIVLAVGAGGGCLDIFSLIYHFSALSPSLWETARYRPKYCFKGPLSPKQPTNQTMKILSLPYYGPVAITFL